MERRAILKNRIQKLIQQKLYHCIHHNASRRMKSVIQHSHGITSMSSSSSGSQLNDVSIMKGLKTNERLNNSDKTKTIYVAMSGGVDSSVAASLLIDSGYPIQKVKPIFVRSWWNDEDQNQNQNQFDPSSSYSSIPSPSVKSNCRWRKDWNDLLKISHQLNLSAPQMIDLSKEYWNRVWEPCLEVWKKGGTPNTDVMCNRYIKFGILAEKLIQIDPDCLIATGHYARLEYEPRLKLLQAKDQKKDQSYYLSTSSSEILQRAIFPIGHLTKAQVRSIAELRGLINANKKDSMGICFVEPSIRKGKFDTFLAQHILQNPGQIVNKAGQVVGFHRGLWSYTIGQRCRIPSQSTKMFVSAKDVFKNQIIVVPS